MKELFSVLRLAVYVLALPLTITAAASAHQWINASTRGDVTAATSSHVVRLTDKGMLRGVVDSYGSAGRATVGNAVVSLLKGSEVIARVTSGVDGAFSFSDIAPGRYTFVSASKDSVSSFGVEVVPVDSEVGDSALRAFAAPRGSVVDGFVAEARDVAEEIETSDVLRSTHSIELVDGIFRGRISAFNGQIAGNTVTLVSGNEVVAEGTTDAQGAFTFPGIEPGFYAVIARGVGGFAAVAVQVNDPTAVAPEETVYTSQVVQQEDFSVTLSGSPVEYQTEEYEIVEEIVSVEEIGETPMGVSGYGGCGGFGGGGCCGGGSMGGFNLGGIGELIGLGIGAWVLTEVIDKIDDNDGKQWTPVPNPPPPISGYNWVYL